MPFVKKIAVVLILSQTIVSCIVFDPRYRQDPMMKKNELSKPVDRELIEAEKDFRSKNYELQHETVKKRMNKNKKLTNYYYKKKRTTFIDKLLFFSRRK